MAIFSGFFNVMKATVFVVLLSCLSFNAYSSTVDAGKYIVHDTFPSYVDTSAYANQNDDSKMKFHGYNWSNDNTLAENTYATIFSYGTIYGDSACRPQDNPYGAWNVVTDWDFERGNQNNGSICWCRLNGSNDPSGNHTYKSKWVARGPVDSGNCWSDCAHDCAQITGNIYRWGDAPKNSLFGTVTLVTADCPAGYYCPGGTISYGADGKFSCPTNSSSTTGQSSCTCDVRYATANGLGATQNNPCVRLTGAASCISGQEYWNQSTQTCVAKQQTYSFLFNSSEYMSPVYDVSSTGYGCHKSRSATQCEGLMASYPNNSWLVYFNNNTSEYFSGRAACSDIWGAYRDVSDVPFDADTIYGRYCWCNTSSPFSSSKWMLTGDFSDGDICANECAGTCAYNFNQDPTFRQIMLSNVNVSTTTCNAGYYCPGGEYGVLDTSGSHVKCPAPYPESATNSYSVDSCYATITFNSNGGSAVATQTFNYTANTNSFSLSTIPTPTKQDYTFLGWWDNSEFSGNQITTQTAFTTSKTLYAKWRSTSATINIVWSDTDAADIAATNAGSTTYGGNVKTPLKPQIKPGKSFLGWLFSSTPPAQ